MYRNMRDTVLAECFTHVLFFIVYHVVLHHSRLLGRLFAPWSIFLFWERGWTYVALLCQLGSVNWFRVLLYLFAGFVCVMDILSYYVLKLPRAMVD